MVLAQSLTLNESVRSVTLNGVAIGAVAFGELLRAAAATGVIELRVSK